MRSVLDIRTAEATRPRWVSTRLSGASVRVVMRALIALALAAPAAQASALRPLVVVGMEDERRAAAGDDVEVVVGAANAKLLRERLAALDPKRFDAVFSFGVSGGLDPKLPAGTLLLSTRVHEQVLQGGVGVAGEGWDADTGLLAAARARAAAAGVTVQTALFLGTDLEARENPETGKLGLFERTGAASIDNESQIAARYAAEHGLPFLAVRALSDSVNHSLPPAALIALDPEDGSPNLSAIAWSVLRQPGQIPALIRTAREYGRALRALRAFRRQVGFAGLVAARGSGA